MKRTIITQATDSGDVLNLGQWPIEEISRAVDDIIKHRVVVFSSSWQHGVATFGILPFDPKRITAIIPRSIEPLKIGDKSTEKGIRLAWVGDPTDGTAHCLLSVFEAMKKQIGSEWDDVTLTIGVTNDTDKLLESRATKSPSVKYCLITGQGITPQHILANSHVFAHPSFSFESQPLQAIFAASAGNVIVVPRHSGFVESVGEYGLLFPHTYDSSVYGMAFAAVLYEAVKSARDTETFTALTAVQKGQIDFKFSKARVGMSWTELDGVLDLVDQSA